MFGSDIGGRRSAWRMLGRDSRGNPRPETEPEPGPADSQDEGE